MKDSTHSHRRRRPARHPAGRNRRGPELLGEDARPKSRGDAPKQRPLEPAFPPETADQTEQLESDSSHKHSRCEPAGECPERVSLNVHPGRERTALTRRDGCFVEPHPDVRGAAGVGAARPPGVSLRDPVSDRVEGLSNWP